MTMVLRKRQDGTTTIQGEAPAEHVFSAGWVARMIEEGFIEVQLTLRTGQPEDPDTVYVLTGFEQLEAPEGDGGDSDSNGVQRVQVGGGEAGPALNYSAWQAERVEEDARG